MSTVTVVTPTTLNQKVVQAVESVENQTHADVVHWLVLDGSEYLPKLNQFDLNSRKKVVLTVLPFPTGKNNFNGHRIYGATSFLCNTDYIAWLDEDNWFDPTHLEAMIELADKHRLDWCHSLRKIMSPEGVFICQDDCECLGASVNVLGDRLVDTSCFLIRTNVAWRIAPLWFRRARQEGVTPADRIITKTLLERDSLRGGCSGEYTLNYRVASRKDSVQGSFFLEGNVKKLAEISPLVGTRPWAHAQTYSPNSNEPEDFGLPWPAF